MMSLADIYLAEFPYIRSCLRRFGTPVSDEVDLVHEVFARMVTSLPVGFDPTRPLRPWIMGIAFRVVREFGRTTARRDPADLGGPLEPLQPDEILEREEVMSAVRSAIARIHPTRRAIFELKHLNEMAIPEIARHLQLPLNTTYSRLRIATAEFRRGLDRVPWIRIRRRILKKRERP
jgi:RNA polymerase sigma-70 factor, ECF subfamily